MAAATLTLFGSASGHDDVEETSLADRLRGSDEVALIRVLDVSEDRKFLTVELCRTAKGRLTAGEVIQLAHPRLATMRGFIEIGRGDRFVVLLFEGVDGIWRPLELGNSSTFVVSGSEILLPSGGTISAGGQDVIVEIGALLAAVEICHGKDEQRCQHAVDEILEKDVNSSPTP